jgi:hypothetical protein
MTRTAFAERIAAGLGGWFQQLAAQNLEHQVGEDAARVELVRMISAQRSYIPETAQRPPNWPTDTKKRIDIAVLGKKSGAQGWYGAIELKWPGYSFDVGATRKLVVEDAVRVAFARTNNLCANFVVLGGSTSSLEKLFDKQHTTSTSKEAKRTAFCSLFSRDLASPQGVLSNAELNNKFPDFGDRVPQTVFNGWSRRLKTTLLTVVQAKVGTNVAGAVYVWQIQR